MSWGTSGPSTSASPARTNVPEWTRKCLPCGTRCSRSMPALALDDDGAFAAALLAEDFHRAVDLGDDGRVLGLAGLEDFGDPRQTAGDVLRAATPRAASWPAACRPRSSCPRRLRCWPFRAGSRSRESCRSASSSTTCGCRSPLCSDDDRADVAAGVLLQADRLAFDRRPRSGPCRRLRPGSGCCAGPIGRAPCRGWTSWSSSTSRLAPAGTSYFSSSRPLGSNNRISPLRVSTTCWPSSLRDDLHAGELHGAGLLRADFAFLDGAGGRAADVERPHRQLRARLADALGGDDARRPCPARPARRWRGPCRSTGAQTPSEASQVIGLRTWIFSSPISSIFRRDVHA